MASRRPSSTRSTRPSSWRSRRMAGWPDGRMSYAELAGKVGLSQAAVRKRVNKLVDHGDMSPVPPKSRVVEDSAWLNSSKTRPSCSGVMSIPESRISKWSQATSSRPTLSTSNRIVPLLVNFDALLRTRAPDAISWDRR